MIQSQLWLIDLELLLQYRCYHVVILKKNITNVLQYSILDKGRAMLGVNMVLAILQQERITVRENRKLLVSLS